MINLKSSLAPVTDAPATAGVGRSARSNVRHWLAGAAVALLVACGGGSSQLEAFVPGRVLAFGDDLSALQSDGRKFAVNGLDTNGNISCALEPLWVQTVATAYGFVFQACNPDNLVTEFKAIMHAAGSAKVADVSAQVDAQVAAGGFFEKDLALVLAGMNDVFELYGRYPNESQAVLLNEARTRGEALAGIVNRLINLNAKVIVSMLPDLGLTPFARAQDLITPGSAAFITALSTAFNERLGVKILLDGRYVGLMQTDLRTQQLVKFTSSFAGLVNVTNAACTVALPNCSTATLVTGATAESYLWADATRMSTAGHSQLATLALERATRNPF